MYMNCLEILCTVGRNAPSSDESIDELGGIQMEKKQLVHCILNRGYFSDARQHESSKPERFLAATCLYSNPMKGKETRVAIESSGLRYWLCRR